MSAPETGPPRTRTWIVLTLLAVLTVLIGAGISFGLQVREARAEQQRYDDVLAAAEAEALAFTTVDYQSLDEDIKRVLDGATGAFQKQYQKSKPQLEALAADNESVSEGKVLSAGVISGDADSARVIVVADSTVSNVNTQSPQPRHYRLQLDLVRRGDRWLTSELRFVG